jgi:hypothetical protein
VGDFFRHAVERLALVDQISRRFTAGIQRQLAFGIQEKRP